MSNKNLLIILSSLVIFLLLVFFFAFRHTPTDQIPDTTNIDQTENVKKEGELVENFPEFPEYPGAEVESSKVEGGTVTDYEAHWETTGEPYEVMEWYINELQQKGWKIVEAPPEEPAGEMFTVLENDEYLYYLTIEKYPDSDITEIELEVVPKEVRGN